MLVTVGAAVFVGVGVGFAVGRGVGVAVGVVGLGVGFAVGVGVGYGPTTMSGDGPDADALATPALGAALACAVPVAERAAFVGLLGELTTVFDAAPADEGWLLVHAARVAAQTTAVAQRARVRRVVRARLAMLPG